MDFNKIFNEPIVFWINVIPIIILWLFKELKKQSDQEIEKKRQRIDRAMELYAECIAALLNYRDDSREKLVAQLVKTIPYANKNIYKALNKCLFDIENIYLHEDLLDQLKNEIEKLRSLNLFINEHDEVSLLSNVSLFMEHIKRSAVPAIYIGIMIGTGIFAYSLWMFHHGNILVTSIQLMSFISYVFIMSAFGDLILQKRFKQNIIGCIILLICPLPSLFWPNLWSVAIFIASFAVAIKIIEKKQRDYNAMVHKLEV